jgi:hypothetical protein
MSQQQNTPGPKSIAVREVRFIRPIHVGDLKFKEGLSTISQDLKQRGLKLEYRPDLRHHAVTIRADANPGSEVKTYYVPDAAVASWEVAG